VFTPIGGVTLQLESAIPTLMVRRVAPRFAAADMPGLRLEESRARVSFWKLSALVALVILPVGWLYMQHVVAEPGTAIRWQEAWLTFCLGYVVNYLFGRNNVLLMGTARTDSFYRIGTFSRALNIGLTFAALVAGLGLLGVSASFLVSVLVNVVAISCVAGNARRMADAGCADAPMEALPAVQPGLRAGGGGLPDETGLARYTLFTLAIYLLYRGTFLLVVGRLDAPDASAYGLALQAFAILGSVAIIPVHVRLHVLARALHDQNAGIEPRELVRAIGFAVVAMLSGLVGVALAGPPLLALIGSDVGLPPLPLLALLAAAFLVEALILVIVNLLVLRRDLGFVIPYVILVLAGLAAGIAALAAGADAAIALLAMPLLVQAIVSLPLMLGRLARHRGEGPWALLKTLALAAPAAGRRG
jgi:hypothetical protein